MVRHGAAAHATTTSGGTATVLVTRRVTAAGLAASAGLVAMDRLLRLLAIGAGTSGGEAEAVLVLRAVASGGSSTAGTATTREDQVDYVFELGHPTARWKARVGGEWSACSVGGRWGATTEGGWAARVVPQPAMVGGIR